MNNLELKELIDAKFSGIKAEVKASHDIQMIELIAIKDRQTKANGKLDRHDCQLLGLDRLQSEILQNIEPIRWARKHYIKAGIYTILVLIVLIKISQYIPLEKIIPLAK